MKNNIKLSGTILSGLAALIVVIGFSFTACAWSTGGPVDKEGTGTDGGGRDSRLINGANDAWVDIYSEGQRDGFIFKADGTFNLLENYYYASPWSIISTGTWTTSGNNSITLIFGTASQTHSYTVSGSSLTLRAANGVSQLYTKTSVTVSGW